MSRGKNKSVAVNGLYGNIMVRVVSRRTIQKKSGDRPNKSIVVNGLYLDASHEILIASELDGHARVSTLMHELGHHLLDTVESIESETAADVVGGYLLRLVSTPDFTQAIETLKKL